MIGGLLFHNESSLILLPLIMMLRFISRNHYHLDGGLMRLTQACKLLLPSVIGDAVKLGIVTQRYTGFDWRFNYFSYFYLRDD